MRLIDADYARDEILFGEAYVSDELAVYIKQLFEELPTIEAKPERFGRWKKVSWWQHKNYYECNECSLCRGRVKRKYTYNYCPHCGAKMRGD